MQYLKTKITDMLGIEHPIVQDGMGPFNTVKLAAAVSNAGGMGTVSMPTMSGDPDWARKTLREHIKTVAGMTDKPFAVNVGVGIDKTTKQMVPVCAAMIETVIEAANDKSIGGTLTALTTSGGFPGPFVDDIKASPLVHIQKVGATRQALKAQEAGADALFASGYEMGGHTHMKPVHTFVLGPNVTEAVNIPVMISGGVKDARGLVAALAMGAEGVGMGTRFIAADANDWCEEYKQRIVESKEGDDTLVPMWFSVARALKGPGIDKLMALVDEGKMSGEELGEYKTAALTAAQRDADFETGIVACGQVATGIHDIVNVAEFVPAMAKEAAEIIQKQNAFVAS
ncbi:MAG: nitronate monooxygenase family protein [Nocardioides sp.]|uniref:NAD(P)H-dependent flavin oxidoreductase n=1 Tax=Nocardioides sp. TaxID=35761 RepID=UPI0039E694AA